MFNKFNKSHLKEEERFIKEVRKFSCLYDKGSEGSKEKNWKKNSWLEEENACTYNKDKN